jgi:anaerobic magnesium-protoporphyrin IX monomethyl ester cyclase
VSEFSDTSRPVVLIGVQHEGSLGLGYLASTLRQHGHTVEVFDAAAEPRTIASQLRGSNPLLVHFSLVFQFHLDSYAALARSLRAQGVDCHFTMGGHFPSLSYEQTLQLVPQLDSVVRFEGELTLLEVAGCLNAGAEWRRVRGLAFRDGSRVALSPLRRLLDDLDQLPFPDRSPDPEPILGQRVMGIEAGRGCERNCSFCSVPAYYRAAPGPAVRTRKPAEVVREMRVLHEQCGITVFRFQDDSFPLFGPVGRRWATQFAKELHRCGLPDRVVWTMNCCAFAVEPDLFISLRKAGLCHVSLGLDSGSAQGLRTLGKQITIEENLLAAEILKDLDLPFRFRFMMFDPSSTFESVRENIEFLRRVAGDGSAPAAFGRMPLHEGTPVKDELTRSGRLRGDACHPRYDYPEPSLNAFSEDMSRALDAARWMNGSAALTRRIERAWMEVAVLERLFMPLPVTPAYKHALRSITQESNEILLSFVEEMATSHENEEVCSSGAQALAVHGERFLGRLSTLRRSLLRYGLRSKTAPAEVNAAFAVPVPAS